MTIAVAVSVRWEQRGFPLPEQRGLPSERPGAPPCADDCRLLQVRVEPGGHARHHVRLIGALEEEMALVGINHEFSLDAEKKSAIRW